MRLSDPAILLIGIHHTVCELWRLIMFCPFCGSQNRDGKKFCRNCGKSMPPPRQVQAPPVLPSLTPAMQSYPSGSGVTGVSQAPATGSIEPPNLPETVGFEALKMPALPDASRPTAPEALSPFQTEIQYSQPNGESYDLEGTAQLPPSVREQRIEEFQEDLDKTAEVPVLPPPEVLEARLEDEKTEEVPVLTESRPQRLQTSAPLVPDRITQPPLSVAPTFGIMASYIPQARPGLSGVEKALIAVAVVTSLLGLLIILWFWVLKPTLNF